MREADVAGAVIELIVFSLPAWWYVRRLSRRGCPPGQARARVGWKRADAASFALAGSAAAVLLPATYFALRALPTGPLGGSGGLHTTYGSATTVGGYAAIAILALAEEILFRGLIAGLTIRRLGFPLGNAVQSFIFLAPHLLLLLVSVRLWPILPVQFAAGWLCGYLRWRSSSIGPSTLTHVIANVAAPLLLAI